MDCLSNVSGAELATLANSIAIYVVKNFSVTDIAKLVAFFTSIADILALLAVDKVDINDSDSTANIPSTIIN